VCRPPVFGAGGGPPPAIADGGGEILYLPAIMLAVYEFAVIGFVPMSLDDEDVCRCTTCEQHRHKAVKKG